jgi:hypothetical protein
MDDPLHTCRHLQELVKRGATPGERAAAQAALDRLLKKYRIGGDDLAGEKTVLSRFAWRDQCERTVFFQCMHALCDPGDYAIYRDGARAIRVELPIPLAIDLREWYAHFRRLWKKEINEFLLAFCGKQRLFGDRESADGPTYSGETIRAIQAKMAGIRRETPHRRLQSPGPSP